MTFNFLQIKKLCRVILMKLKSIIIITAIIIILFVIEICKSSYYEGLEDNTSKNSFATGLDVIYHTEIDRDTSNDITLNVTDFSGNPTTATISKTLGNATYYNPGYYSYGGSSYIPNYEDAMNLANVKNTNRGTYFRENDKDNSQLSDQTNMSSDLQSNELYYNEVTEQEQKLQELNQKTELDDIIVAQNRDVENNEKIKAANLQNIFTRAPSDVVFERTNNDYDKIRSYPGNYLKIIKENENNSDVRKTTPSRAKKFYIGDFLNDSIYNT
jgi:hypothetical protein